MPTRSPRVLNSLQTFMIRRSVAITFVRSRRPSKQCREDLTVAPLLKPGLLPFLSSRVSFILRLMCSDRSTSLQELPLLQPRAARKHITRIYMNWFKGMCLACVERMWVATVRLWNSFRSFVQVVTRTRQGPTTADSGAALRVLLLRVENDVGVRPKSRSGHNSQAFESLRAAL
jgi:hypothetical protein